MGSPRSGATNRAMAMIGRESTLAGKIDRTQLDQAISLQPPSVGFFRLL
jgi:hypothetical protein